LQSKFLHLQPLMVISTSFLLWNHRLLKCCFRGPHKAHNLEFPVKTLQNVLSLMCVALHCFTEESHLAIHNLFSCSPFTNKHSLFNGMYFPSLLRPSEPHALYAMTNKFQACSSCLVISYKATTVSHHIHTCQVHIFVCFNTK